MTADTACTDEARWELLLGSRLGIVRNLEPLALPRSLPRGLHAFMAQTSETGGFALPLGNAETGGCAWFDANAARRAAIAEAAERYCGHMLPAGLRPASFAQLEAAGEAAIDPRTLALYAGFQYETPGFPFLPFTDDLEVLWTQGSDLSTGQPVLVPASLVYLNYFTGPVAHEPMTNLPINAGIAAGMSGEDAERAAIEELIERDAIAVAWVSGARLPRIEPPGWMETLFAGPKGCIDTTLHLFPNLHGLPVLGAVLRDRSTGLLTMGTACRLDPVAAAMKAYAEAALLQVAAQQLDDPNSTVMQGVTEAGNALKPHRPRRDYCACYRPDWRDVTNISCHVQLYLDPEMQALLEARLASDDRMHLSSLPVAAVEPTSARNYYVRALEARGINAVAVDLTTPDVEACGLHVVRVVAPGLRTTAPAAFPFLGGLAPNPLTLRLSKNLRLSENLGQAEAPSLDPLALRRTQGQDPLTLRLSKGELGAPQDERFAYCDLALPHA